MWTKDVCIKLGLNRYHFYIFKYAYTNMCVCSSKNL